MDNTLYFPPESVTMQRVTCYVRGPRGGIPQCVIPWGPKGGITHRVIPWGTSIGTQMG